jgi:2-hydroxychromene-2-carboxylate isomerase
MATIIDLAEARARRERRARGPHETTFAFDLASPRAYFAAPVVAERFPAAVWRPVLGPRGLESARDVEAAAARLGVAFAWPEGGLPEGRMAARVAAAIDDPGRLRDFALALLRLTWAHGEDLDEIGTLARAAGIAGVELDVVLDHAFDPRGDGALEQAGQTSSRNTISVESERRGPSLRMRV